MTDAEIRDLITSEFERRDEKLNRVYDFLFGQPTKRKRRKKSEAVKYIEQQLLKRNS